MTRRFYVDAPLPPDGEVLIEGDLAHRLTNVLRLRAGDEVALFDGSGDDVRVRIERIQQKAATAAVIERVAGPPEPRVIVRLYQSITKGERFEWLLEKGTEIGVSHFVPLITARSVVKTAGEGNRMDRWRRIVIEAAEQCGRSRVPAISAPATFSEVLSSAPGLLLFPYEAAGDAAPNIQSALGRDIDALFALGEVSIFIGPEGGYEPGEVEAAAAAGAAIVTMGERVLRSETAGLVAATLVLHAAGELG
jgi:16S rRNA (uracil1498-N3)-methyltransferase